MERIPRKWATYRDDAICLYPLNETSNHRISNQFAEDHSGRLIEEVLNMSTLAEHWDEWTEHELDMMLTALDWYIDPANGKQGINAGLLPFIPKERVLNAVKAYMRAFVWNGEPDEIQWAWLVNRITNGPIIKKER